MRSRKSDHKFPTKSKSIISDSHSTLNGLFRRLSLGGTQAQAEVRETL